MGIGGTKIKLGKIFLIQAGVLALTAVVVSILMFCRFSMKNLEERITSDVRVELQIVGREIGHRVDMAVEQTAVISGLTMIRSALCSYHNGNLSLEDLREYTQPKYEDGASVYENLLFVRRTYLDGTVVALYGDPASGPADIPENTGLTFLRHQGSYALVVRSSLVHNGTFLGYDTALFTLGPVVRPGGLFLENQQVLSDSAIDDGGGVFCLAAPIGDTGWFLHADLNRDILEQEIAEIRGSVLLISAALILAVLALSWVIIRRVYRRD